MSISDLPHELLQDILLLAASNDLGPTYYALATVCRSFNGILSNRTIKLSLLAANKHDLLGKIASSWLGAPDLESILTDYVASIDAKEKKHILAVAPSERHRYHSLLNLAVDRRFRGLAQLLISRGADPTSGTFGRKDYYCVSPVWKALEHDDLPMLRLLLDADADNPYNGFYTGQEIAKSPGAHRLLLQASGCDGPNYVIQYACAKLDPPSVRLALALGATVSVNTFKDMVDYFEDDDLADFLACTELLVDAGLDPNDMLSALAAGEVGAPAEVA
ncbi:hypothetical protein DFJ73DRAFT_801520, partial [Zopfochytrium polystomum]